MRVSGEKAFVHTMLQRGYVTELATETFSSATQLHQDTQSIRQKYIYIKSSY